MNYLDEIEKIVNKEVSEREGLSFNDFIIDIKESNDFEENLKIFEALIESYFFDTSSDFYDWTYKEGFDYDKYLLRPLHCLSMALDNEREDKEYTKKFFNGEI